MQSLDLHGVKHKDVQEKVEEFIASFDAKYIITGNSNVMKKIVIEVLNKHDIKHMCLSHNLGQIILV